MYSETRTAKRHFRLIRDYLQLRPFNHEANQILIDTMSKLAFSKDDPADLVNAVIEELIRKRYELPVYITLKDAANEVRNKSYRAIYHRELGRVIRTMFLLKYMADEELRGTIQAATNKSEAFNGFTKWIFFCGEGIIAENDREKQRKVIKYNHLVANCLIFYNVFSLSRILHDYMQDGNEYDEELISYLSPYVTAHVNRFGKYRIDLNRKPPKLPFEVPVAREISVSLTK
ncbi:Tn3 family transposase [Neobacillus sp. OS1-33]|uniref:Tn3 family transposase n=1 Tax=Neobacillus sp. OS1-33 TaxID=3070683 RepID=UPI0027DEC328|nr:Tn3 family transposase [Neobacillus sp. OS1-33]WML27345.1 Tn3 family transposase [Neobacillus sp. OS1-33]